MSSAGYLRSESVSKRPSASATALIPSASQRVAQSRVIASTAARAAPLCAIPGKPLVRRDGDARDHPAAARAQRTLDARARHLPSCRRR